jgi:hypothetical protein
VNHGITGASVFIAFHEQRVLPLMERARRLDEMVPGAPIEDNTFVRAAHPQQNQERIKAGLGSIPDDAALDLCPSMRPNHGFVEMLSALLLLVP